MNFLSLPTFEQFKNSFTFTGQINVAGYDVSIGYDDSPCNPREYDQTAVMALEHSRYNLGDKDTSSELLDLIHAELNELMVEKYPKHTSLDFGCENDSLPCLHCNDDQDINGQDDCPHCKGNGWIDNPFFVSSEDIFESMSVLNEHKEKPSEFFYRKVYLYDHSGITISNSPFGCRWDSGLTGYAFVTKDAITELYKHIPEEHKCADLETQAYKVIDAEIHEYDDFLTGNVFFYKVESLSGDVDECCYDFVGDSGRDEAISQAYAHLETAIKAANQTYIHRLKDLIRNKVPYLHRQAVIKELAEHNIRFI